MKGNKAYEIIANTLIGDEMINQKKLLSLMVLKGLSRKQLSSYLNCSYQTLTKKINGKAAFKDHELKKLSELLDVSINELYD